MSTDNQELKKILLLGDAGVGKSQIMNNWADSIFTDHYIATIGMDFKIKVRKIDDIHSVKFQIWDSAGQERFKTLTASYYRVAQVFILVFDVTDRVSFTNLKSYLDEVRKHTQESNILLVANKIDQVDKRVVSKEEAEQFAQQHNLRYYEVSAKQGFDVTLLENTLLELSPLSERAQSEPLRTKTQLKQEIETFKTAHTNNQTIQDICTILETGIAKTDSEAYFEEQLPELKQHIESLRWNFWSIVNSVANLVATVIGVPLDKLFGFGWVKANEQATGDSYLFFKFGPRQQSTALANQTFAEKRLDFRV